MLQQFTEPERDWPQAGVVIPGNLTSAAAFADAKWQWTLLWAWVDFSTHNYPPTQSTSPTPIQLVNLCIYLKKVMYAPGQIVGVVERLRDRREYHKGADTTRELNKRPMQVKTQSK